METVLTEEEELQLGQAEVEPIRTPKYGQEEVERVLTQEEVPQTEHKEVSGRSCPQGKYRMKAQNCLEGIRVHTLLRRQTVLHPAGARQSLKMAEYHMVSLSPRLSDADGQK